VADETRIDFEFRVIREAISRDWTELASRKLNAEQRRAVREHLSVHVTALRELAERHPLALRIQNAMKSPAENH